MTREPLDAWLQRRRTERAERLAAVGARWWRNALWSPERHFALFCGEPVLGGASVFCDDGRKVELVGRVEVPS